MLTPKQQNLQARAARDTAVTNMEDVLSKLRLRREPLLRNLAHMEEEMRQAKNAGESVARFEPTIQKYKLLLKQLESEILKAEVDLHAARANVVKLVPER